MPTLVTVTDLVAVLEAFQMAVLRQRARAEPHPEKPCLYICRPERTDADSDYTSVT